MLQYAAKSCALEDLEWVVAKLCVQQDAAWGIANCCVTIVHAGTVDAEEITRVR